MCYLAEAHKPFYKALHNDVPSMAIAYLSLARHTFRTLWNRGVAFERELLQPRPLIGLRGEDVALRVDGNTVHREEHARLAATVAKRGQNFHRLALDDVHLHVLAVREVHVLLVGVPRECDIPGRAVAHRHRRDPRRARLARGRGGD